jgi:predicted anti-sigma-YlaC factor YlaD
VVSRRRDFQRQILVEQEKLERTGAVEEARLLEGLRTQTEQAKRRARLIRTALMFLLSAVGLLIICSLTLAFIRCARQAALFAAAFFVFGLISMLCGIMAALMELRALEPVELEARFVSRSVDPSIAEALQSREPSAQTKRKAAIASVHGQSPASDRRTVRPR